MFDGARLKVKRAEKHIDDLRSVINAFGETDFCRLIRQTDPKTGKEFLKAQLLKGPPEDVALLIGDAAHNLHSALDLMWHELIGLVGGSSGRSNFPFQGTRKELVGAVNSGPVQRAHHTIRDFIIDGIKPYRGGNDTLYALHKLDIADKHKIITPLIHVAEMEVNYDVNLGGFTAIKVQGASIQQTSTGGEESIELSPGTDVTGDYEPTLEILFRADSPFKRKPVLNTLTNLALMVDRIIEDMCRVYLSTIP